MAETINKQTLKTISLQDVYVKFGKRSKEKGKNIELSLTNSIELEVIEDFRFLKKGQIIKASELETEFLKEAGVVKEIK